jgi:hypothetical protein
MLLHEAGSYPKMPNARGGSFDKEADDFSSDEDAVGSASGSGGAKGAKGAATASGGRAGAGGGAGGGACTGGGGAGAVSGDSSQQHPAKPAVIEDDIDDADSDW